MSLINHIEIIEQDKNKLNDYLIEELKKTSSWRENRPDSIEDQCKFYQSYFAKKNKEKMHINQEIIKNLLKENEILLKNTKRSYQDNFVDLIYDEPSNRVILYYYNSDTRNLSEIIITISNENNLDVELTDLNEVNSQIDTRLVEIKNVGEKILLSDLYSIYELTSDFQGNLTTKKRLQLEETPNCFLSQIFIDQFFVISKGNNKNTITLVDSDFNIINCKNFNDNSTEYTKGDFINQLNLCACISPRNVMLCDFRTSGKVIDNLLYSTTQESISDVKYIENFYFFTASSENINLFDLRYPTLPISTNPLNINYSDIQLKKTLSNDETNVLYLMYDSSRKDHTNMQLEVFPEKVNFFDSFCKFDMLKSDKIQLEIHDAVSFIFTNEKNKYNLNFIVDNLNGVYLNLYDISRDSFEYTSENISQFNGEKFKKENNDIKSRTLYGDLFDLYQKLTADFMYNESALEFGEAFVNEKEKKMFKIESKREVIEKVKEDEEESDTPKVSEDTKDVEMEKEDEKANQNEREEIIFLNSGP